MVVKRISNSQKAAPWSRGTLVQNRSTLRDVGGRAGERAGGWVLVCLETGLGFFNFTSRISPGTCSKPAVGSLLVIFEYSFNILWGWTYKSHIQTIF